MSSSTMVNVHTPEMIILGWEIFEFLCCNSNLEFESFELFAVRQMEHELIFVVKVDGPVPPGWMGRDQSSTCRPNSTQLHHTFTWH